MVDNQEHGEDEAAEALREATFHLELARNALGRQRAAMEGVSTALLRERANGERLRAALNSSVDGESDLLVSTLSAKGLELNRTLRSFTEAQPASGARTIDILGKAQRAAQNEAEAALALLRAQGAFAQAAAEAQRTELAQEEGFSRVLSEGREMVAAGAREVAEALRTQAEVLLIAQRLQEMDIGDGSKTIAGIAESLQSSLPLLGNV